MLPHAAGLAASPVVFYKLVVGGARRLPFLFQRAALARHIGPSMCGIESTKSTSHVGAGLAWRAVALSATLEKPPALYRTNSTSNRRIRSEQARHYWAEEALRPGPARARSNAFQAAPYWISIASLSELQPSAPHGCALHAAASATATNPSRTTTTAPGRIPSMPAGQRGRVLRRCARGTAS